MFVYFLDSKTTDVVILRILWNYILQLYIKYLRNDITSTLYYTNTQYTGKNASYPVRLRLLRS